MDGGKAGEPVGWVKSIVRFRPSLREAKRQSNTELHKYTLDSRASLAMTDWEKCVYLGI